MSTLVRASELAKKPVVTFGGEDIAQVKDIVYGSGGGEVSAFTLAGRGIFSGPLKTSLPWPSVVGLGPDAVIVESEQALVPNAEILSGGGGGGNVLGNEVLTEDGTALGRVSDVIIGLLDAGGQADVVGYEIEPVETLARGRQRLLIPLPDTLAISGSHLIVPASARHYLTDDLSAFGTAVDAFRAQLAEGGTPPPAPTPATVSAAPTAPPEGAYGGEPIPNEGER